MSVARNKIQAKLIMTAAEQKSEEKTFNYIVQFYNVDRRYVYKNAIANV